MSNVSLFAYPYKARSDMIVFYNLTPSWWVIYLNLFITFLGIIIVNVNLISNPEVCSM